jgi:hypothetical protein
MSAVNVCGNEMGWCSSFPSLNLKENSLLRSNTFPNGVQKEVLVNDPKLGNLMDRHEYLF